MRRNGSGFTLVELAVALTVSGVVLLGSRAIWESIDGAADRLGRETAAANARANGDRLLRSLLDGLEIGTDHSREFAGDERTVRFTTWCTVSAGWQERCDAALAIEPTADRTAEEIVARLSTGERVTLRRGFTTGTFRYLGDPHAGGVWYRVWSRGITAPLAVGVITDGDTTIVRIGERG
jgi:prepilin-type N-terminal cleavage/methylation domain-containing protein